MAYARVNLKYGEIDDWVEIGISNSSESIDANTTISKNAEGTESYLQLGSPIINASFNTIITNSIDIMKIRNYLIVNLFEIEVDIYGYGKRLARMVPSHSGTAQNGINYLEASYNITLINE